jgi:hypothetical protein
MFTSLIRLLYVILHFTMYITIPVYKQLYCQTKFTYPLSLISTSLSYVIARVDLQYYVANLRLCNSGYRIAKLQLWCKLSLICAIVLYIGNSLLLTSIILDNLMR